MTTSNGHKKYVAILVHADMWGAQNANKLVKAVAAQSAEPILIVTRSTRNADGSHKSKVDALNDARIIKEDQFLKFLADVDTLESSAAPELLSFSKLAQQYDGQIHVVLSGNARGGNAIAAYFETLEQHGIIPEVVLSGDTLAFIPEAILNKYDCFSTHPGNIERVPGIAATARAVIHQIFCNEDGRDIDDVQHHSGPLYVKGTLFKCAKEVDSGGQKILETTTQYRPEESFLQLRQRVYDDLIEAMISTLPEMLHASKRNELTKNKPNITNYDEAPNLTTSDLNAWTEHAGKSSVSEALIDPEYMERTLRKFVPNNQLNAFTTLLSKHFTETSPARSA